MDSNSPSSSVHGILQARILEWVAVSSSMGSSQPRDQTYISCIAGRFFTVEINEISINKVCINEKSINKILNCISFIFVSIWISLVSKKIQSGN